MAGVFVTVVFILNADCGSEAACRDMFLRHEPETPVSSEAPKPPEPKDWPGSLREEKR